MRRRGAVLFVHPFAEELNKSRRAVAVAARGLADDGWAVLTLDLLGCGDSSGDFSEASWDAWLNDVSFAYIWLQERYGCTPVLWGLRAGCLLATAALGGLPAAPDLLLWQPILSGNAFLGQFMRLKAAAEMLGEQATRTTTKELLEQLINGTTIEVAGYSVPPALAVPLRRAELDIPEGYAGRVMWCEVAPDDAKSSLSPAATMRVERWRALGIKIESIAVHGLPFWQTQEIAECPEIEVASRAFMRSLVQ
jgi:uncharacterized protein